MRRSSPFIALLGILALTLALAARCAQQPQQPNPHPPRARSNALQFFNPLFPLGD